MKKQNLAVSLFSGAGIGDIGFRAAGLDFLLKSEIEPDRIQLAKINFPEAQMFTGDIVKYVDEISAYALQQCSTDKTELFLISCTAPCQGMSKSGQGTLLKNIREGKRPKLDPRNRLILPALQIIKKIQPRFVVFENVCEMRNTLIEDEQGNLRLILDIIRDTLGNQYEGEAYEVEMADYGVPQRRKRLITVFTRDENALAYYHDGISLIPEPTHSKNPTGKLLPWISVEEALRNFPKLDAKNKKTAAHPNLPFHRVPVLDSKKYEWIKNTPPGASAFDNQCLNSECGFTGNRTHGASKNIEGINQAHKNTPLYCERCGQLLPRPYTINQDGTLRIMSGYKSAYKRMESYLPCPALTRNLSFPCSDNKVHPYENRVLSLAEAFVLHSLDRYEYYWGPMKDLKNKQKEVAPDGLIRLVIGESIPPWFTEQLGRHLIKLSKENSSFKLGPKQFSMLNCLPAQRFQA